MWAPQCGLAVQQCHSLCCAHVYIQEHQYRQLRQSQNLREHCNYLQVALASCIHIVALMKLFNHSHSTSTVCMPQADCIFLGKGWQAKALYVPQMMREANDKSGPQFQRMTWDALRKSLNGLINKVNVQNIKEILPDIFREVLNSSPDRTLSFVGCLCIAPSFLSCLCVKITRHGHCDGLWQHSPGAKPSVHCRT